MREIVRGKIVSYLLVTFIFIALAVCVQGNGWAFSGGADGHSGITDTVLKNITVSVNGKTLSFSDKAIKEIVDENKNADNILNGNFLRSAFHFDNELFGDSTARLVNLKNEAINAVIKSSPDGSSARRHLGGAFHTLQDFYSHSNWVHFNTGIDERLGIKTYTGPVVERPCPRNKYDLEGEGLSNLTTGFFRLHDPWWAPDGKCRHGAPELNIQGIAIDSLANEPYGRRYYSTAYDRALQATREFINQVLNHPDIKGDEKALRALLDRKSTLGFVIDDTGSMGDDIEQVKTQVARIINRVKGTSDEPSQYLLVRFGDPDVGSAFATSDADAFMSAVNALYAHSGGDCPEYSMSGLLNAIAAAQNGATLYMFTDASSKDGYLAPNVTGAAQEKGIKATFALTGSCSPIDPAYFKIADETGGQLFFLDTSEIGEIFTLVEPELSGDFVTIFSTNGTLANSNRIFNVPLDSSLSRAVFSVSHFFDTGVRRDTDFYAFSGNAGDVITADVSAYRIGSPLYYSQLSLYASDGTVLAQNIDWYGYNGYDPKINYDLPDDGIYYLGVSDIYGRTGSAYYYTLTLTANGNSTVIDIGNEIEPNNSTLNATNIAYGNLIHGNFGYVPPEQVPVKVYRPSGIPVAQGEPNVTITSLNYGTVVSVEAPEHGIWSFDISGTGEYSAKVMGNSSIQFESFQFVERYYIGHSPTTYFPIPGQPVIGKTHIGQATLFGNFKSASFRLITEQGDTIQPIDLKQGDPDASPGDFVGSIMLPSSSFRVAVSGIDQNDRSFDRVFPTLFTPQGIQVVPNVTTSGLREGRTDIIEFIVTNAGSRGTFEMFATDNRGFISDITPRILTLENGSSTRVEVAITVPLGTVTGTDVLLSVSANNVSDPNIFNSASVFLMVINNLPPIANAGTDQVVSAGTLVSLNGRDSVDPDYGPTPLAFVWNQTEGSASVTLTGADTATPTFTPVTAGDYTFSLMVNDGEYDSVPDTVTVTVYPINWAIVKLLPSTPKNKAGRTMPVKFSLRIDSSVDPNQPFIYSEDIRIMIYRCDNAICKSKTLMQNSVYGSSAADYRIDQINKLYITNFKTSETPAIYIVEVLRLNSSLIGSFMFKTDK